MPGPLIPLAIAGISALGNYLANRKSSQSQSTEAPRDITQTPIYDPETLDLRNNLMSMYMDRARFNDDFISGYTREGLQNINRGSDIAENAISNILASRGLSQTSAGTSSLVQNILNRINQQSNFLNTLPMVQDERQRNNLADLSGFFKSLPTGYSQVGTSGSTTTATNPGNSWAGLLGGLGGTLAGLYGQGAFSPKTKAPTQPTIPMFSNVPDIDYRIMR